MRELMQMQNSSLIRYRDLLYPSKHLNHMRLITQLEIERKYQVYCFLTLTLTPFRHLFHYMRLSKSSRPWHGHHLQMLQQVSPSSQVQRGREQVSQLLLMTQVWWQARLHAQLARK